MLPADELHDAWRAAVARELKGAPLDALNTTLREGVTVAPLYAAGDTAPAVRAALGARHGWVVRQPYGVASGALPEALADDRAGGVTSFAWTLESPATVAHPAGARAQLGATLAGLRALDLRHHHVALTAPGDPMAALAALDAACEDAGLPSDAALATIFRDPIASTLAGSDATAARWEPVAALVRAAAARPGLRAWGVDMAVVQRGGGDAVVQLAAVLAAVKTGLARLAALGVGAADAFAHLEVQVGVGRDLFVEVSALRAVRLGLAALAVEAGVSGADAAARVAAASTTYTRVYRDPWTNILRGSTEAVAAIWGGADAITIAPFDAARGPASAQARRIARNTQHVLRDEAHLGDVADPCAGSWYVEELTDAILAAAQAKAAAFAALEPAAMALAIAEATRATWGAERARIAARRVKVVGANVFTGVDVRGSDVGAGDAAPGVGGGGDSATIVPVRESVDYDALWRDADGAPVQVRIVPVGEGKIGPRLDWTAQVFGIVGAAVRTTAPAADAAAAVALGAGADVVAVVAADDAFEAAALPAVRALVAAGGTHVVAVASRKVVGAADGVAHDTLYDGRDLSAFLQGAVRARSQGQ